MQTTRRFRLAPLYAVAGLAPVLLTLALPALSSHSETSPQTPQQVADTLDSIVQPRFQKNAGRFGVDRVLLEGHDMTYGLAAENIGEQRKFQQINAAHRPYVIAFLHCAHKPGKFVHSAERADGKTSPYVETLAAETATEDGVGKLWEWSGVHLDKAVLPEIAALRRGNGVDKDFGNWRVVLRPVRADHEACLGCHAGAKRGDTLGVMVYAVDKNTIRLPLKSTIVGLQ